jgi:hypothetical protein
MKRKRRPASYPAVLRGTAGILVLISILADEDPRMPYLIDAETLSPRAPRVIHGPGRQATPGDGTCPARTVSGSEQKDFSYQR